MKLVVLSVWSCLLSVLVYGQEVVVSGGAFAVALQRSNIAYEGVWNPLKIVVENLGCNQLIVTTDNGEMKQRVGCTFDYRPARPGTALLMIKKKEAGVLKEIGKVKYEIKALPMPEAGIGGMHGAVYDAGFFKTHTGLFAVVPGFEIEVAFRIKSYTVAVIRSGQLIFSKVNNQATFEPAVKKVLQGLQAKDEVVFSDIACLYPDDKIVKLKPLEVTID